MVSTTQSIPMPTDAAGWLHEIAIAYLDAAETIPVAPIIGFNMKPSDLFHLGPTVCMKFRGIKGKRKFKKATNAALVSYVAMTERQPGALKNPHMAFAFCYLAAHFGLDLLSEEQVGALMDFIEEHEGLLAEMIDLDGAM